MPIEYVQSGPEFTRDNQKITPMAPIYICEGCGYRGAAFGIGTGEHSRHYCGWKDGQPMCVGKGRTSQGGRGTGAITVQTETPVAEDPQFT